MISSNRGKTFKHFRERLSLNFVYFLHYCLIFHQIESSTSQYLTKMKLLLLLINVFNHYCCGLCRICNAECVPCSAFLSCNIFNAKYYVFFYNETFTIVFWWQVGSITPYFNINQVLVNRNCSSWEWSAILELCVISKMNCLELWRTWKIRSQSTRQGMESV